MVDAIFFYHLFLLIFSGSNLSGIPTEILAGTPTDTIESG
jgi:hypothetical protein